jgi:CRISPR/Cas system-associated exonuclease Cas4 (RecB family)
MSIDHELDTILENWDSEKITIRPSAVDGFMQCPRQWALTHIAGMQSMPGARAAIGTAIHAAVEQEWKEAMVTGKKDFNISAMEDLAVAELNELDQGGLNYDAGEDVNTATKEARAGVRSFAEDIAPFTDIPIAVETRYTVDIDNPVVSRLSGTVDYINTNTIADVKTSKRKPVPANYTTQQSIYKYLAESNGQRVDHNLIQGVVLKAKPEGHILELKPDIEKAKVAVNAILDTVEAFNAGIRPSLLFRGNPKYYLCQDKYCALHRTCPYAQGEIKETVKPKVSL